MRRRSLQGLPRKSITFIWLVLSAVLLFAGCQTAPGVANADPLYHYLPKNGDMYFSCYVPENRSLINSIFQSYGLTGTEYFLDTTQWTFGVSSGDDFSLINRGNYSGFLIDLGLGMQDNWEKRNYSNGVVDFEYYQDSRAIWNIALFQDKVLIIAGVEVFAEIVEAMLSEKDNMQLDSKNQVPLLNFQEYSIQAVFPNPAATLLPKVDMERRITSPVEFARLCFGLSSSTGASKGYLVDAYIRSGTSRQARATASLLKLVLVKFMMENSQWNRRQAMDKIGIDVDADKITVHGLEFTESELSDILKTSSNLTN